MCALSSPQVALIHACWLRVSLYASSWVFDVQAGVSLFGQGASKKESLIVVVANGRVDDATGEELPVHTPCTWWHPPLSVLWLCFVACVPSTTVL